MAIDANSSPALRDIRDRAAGFYDVLRRLLQAGWVRSRRHAVLSLGLLALLIAGLAYLVLAGGSEAQGSYATSVVQRGNIQDTVTALGNLQPRDYVDVGAQVSGQLKKIYVELGDRVKQGQLLAEIDPRVLNSKVERDKSDLANLKAQLADRHAQLALARANFARQRRLLKADATSRNDYDSALQALRSAEAQSSSLQAQIAAAKSLLDGDQVTLGYTKIYAPMDGTVVSIAAKQGQTLNANQQAPTILRIADLSTMTVWTQVSEADVPKLKVGMPAYFTTLGEPGKRWTGTLTQIQPTPDVVNNVVLYTATFDVRNPDDQLMTQMTAQVFFVTASAKDVVIVPVAALHRGRARSQANGASAGDGRNAAGAKRQRHRRKPDDKPLPAGAKRYWVSAVKPDGAIEHRRIVVGVSNRVSAEVLSGLKPGERVIVGTNEADTGAGDADRARMRRFHGFGGFH
jgi:macrolide-specific efflux system membrane fusion protein